MEQGRAAKMKGYDKVKNSCSVARENGYDYIWIDACCIDKSSSAELSEAINSMYRWYQEAEVCYAYLADISSVSQFTQSKWFTRGWTLQELIAPSNMVFFDKDWKGLGTKTSLGKSISERTRIPQAILDGTKHLETASVAQRMSWAVGRKTARIEDQAYCLMGIFGINMPLLYGEGVKAFLRLQEEIMKVSDDHSLFAWRHPKPANGSGGLLAVSPDAFKHSGSIISWNRLTPYNSPLTITNKGIYMDAPFIAEGPRGMGLIILNCTEIGMQDHLIGIYLQDSFLTMEYFERCMPEELRLINLKQFSPSQYPTRNLCIRLQDHASLWRAVSPSQELRPMHLERKLLSSVVTGNGEDKSPEQRLFHAASKGDEDGVRRLLALPNIQVDFKDGEARTPLSFAAEAGNGRIVQLVLNSREVDINSKDSNGSSPLAYASARGHEDVVWLLLGRSDVVINTSDNWGRTLLSLAARGGHVSLVSQLLSRGDTRTYLVDDKGQSVLSHAAEEGHAAIVRMLLSSGKIHPDLKDQEGRSSLWYASKNGHVSIVNMLLETGWVDPTSKDKDGISPIWHAASNGHGSVVKLLLASHVDIEGCKDGRTLLCQASAHGHVDVVRQLLNSGANPNTRDDDGGTGLWYSTMEGHEAIVELLLEFGANPNTTLHPGRRHRTVLCHAVERGYDIIVKLLLDKGANPDVRGYRRRTALELASQKGFDTIVKMLLDKSAKGCRTGGKALRLAVSGGHETTVRLLREKVSSYKDKDSDIVYALPPAC